MLFLALRQLLSKMRQTVLTLLGIVLGTAAFIAISGMMLGFQEFIINQLVNNDSHIRISAREHPVTEDELNPVFFQDFKHIFWKVPPSGRRDDSYLLYPQSWFDRLQNDPNVKAYSQQITSQVIVTRGKVNTTARLIGSDPVRQLQVTNIAQYITSGDFKDIGQGGNRIIAGEGFLEKLGSRVNETIQIATAKGTSVPFKVIGSFRLGIKGIDDTTMFGSISDVQKVNGTPSQISDIAVRLINVERASDLANAWGSISKDKVQSWDQANEGTMSVFKTQDIVRNSMTISILVVAAFGIYNILSIAVNQRKKEIAILRSMGFEPSDITNLFFIQGVILGTIGGLIGILLGFLISKYMSTIEVSSQRFLGGGKMMVSFNYLIYIKAFFLAFFSATIASILPARAAGKLEPIDIIRTEGS